MTRTFYIVKGSVTNTDPYDEDVKEGDTEWQISDGPVENRSIIHENYVGKLEYALRVVTERNPGCVFIWDKHNVQL